MSHINGVVLDAFGTIVQPVPKNGPYSQILSAHVNFRDARNAALTLNFPLQKIAEVLGLPPVPVETLEELDVERRNIALYPDVRDFCRMMKKQNIKIAICSNLAFEYGEPLRQLVPEADAYCFSYEVGFYKPQPEIYGVVCNQLQMHPEQLLFIGDTPAADLTGPSSYGMRATLINRNAGHTLVDRFLAV